MDGRDAREAARRALEARDGRDLPTQLALTRIARKWLGEGPAATDQVGARPAAAAFTGGRREARG